MEIGEFLCTLPQDWSLRGWCLSDGILVPSTKSTSFGKPPWLCVVQVINAEVVFEYLQCQCFFLQVRLFVFSWPYQ